MKYAFKEWDVTVEALGKGLITAVWRKGGIEDTPSFFSEGSFNIEQNQFILYPTYHHQSIQKIKRNLWSLENQNKQLIKDNQVQIKYWAEIYDSIEIENIEQLLAISSYVVNENHHLAESFNTNPEHKGKILILRVYELSIPILIPNSKNYAGCKSWIELNIDIPKIRSKSVLGFKEFNHTSKKIKSLIRNLSTQNSDPSELVSSTPNLQKVF